MTIMYIAIQEAINDPVEVAPTYVELRKYIWH
jgi:hypothetical protein